ncbi:FAD-binding oxidoreductase [Thiobacillus sedimenti]|uniref:FAD-linked oxidase C-terminal domain-containing protein n=1 Tax=Thiobacillus sedimenti TaxID=3110231 RepID=A0ABZ1CH23_9PROT|nr:FAD-linked oxidase C-terminal domain-containing protein [Thiobacillus sp. SCUT-2]WRS38527.1 FAD-linked oxidase C-terminal domain-containing protein [Thiobacillus sp. SCUT-2]
MLPKRALAAFRSALGADRVFDDAATRALYASDETPRRVDPDAVLFPASHDQVAALMRVAFEHRVAVTPRGAGSGNVGGALPAPGSVVVSFECMRRVLEFNPVDRLVVVEPGVVTRDIDHLAREAGLFYPPDPGSGDYCRIGGNLAMNAAGPRAVKYGVTRDYALGLRAVTGRGEEIRTGCRTTKGVTGYDLTRLLVGSGGTLALITEATLKLLPAPESVATLRVCFADTRTALDAVARVMRQAVMPSALEFMDQRAIDAIRPTGTADDLPVGTRALLMVEADGTAAELPRQIAALEAALDGPGLLEAKSGFERDAIARLWAARKSLSHAVKQIAPLKINEDVVVPVSRLADFVDFLDHTARAQRLAVVSFGHAGNGNLHVNLMVHPDDADEMARAQRALEAIMQQVLALGGTLSGEHGIGTEKRRFVPQEIDAVTLELMRAIKRQFDPHGLLNPGKIFPD